jgi:hypothetical protein
MPTEGGGGHLVWVEVPPCRWYRGGIEFNLLSFLLTNYEKIFLFSIFLLPLVGFQILALIKICGPWILEIWLDQFRFLMRLDTRDDGGFIMGLLSGVAILSKWDEPLFIGSGLSSVMKEESRRLVGVGLKGLIEQIGTSIKAIKLPTVHRGNLMSLFVRYQVAVIRRITMNEAMVLLMEILPK